MRFMAYFLAFLGSSALCCYIYGPPVRSQPDKGMQMDCLLIAHADDMGGGRILDPRSDKSPSHPGRGVLDLRIGSFPQLPLC